MIVASLIVKCDKAHVNEIVIELNKIPDVTTYGIHKENNIIALIEAESEVQLKELSRYISSEFEGVMGTYPTFIGNDDLKEPTNISNNN